MTCLNSASKHWTCAHTPAERDICLLHGLPGQSSGSRTMRQRMSVCVCIVISRLYLILGCWQTKAWGSRGGVMCGSCLGTREIKMGVDGVGMRGIQVKMTVCLCTTINNRIKITADEIIVFMN